MTLLYLISAFRPAFTPTIAKASKSSQYLLKAAAARYFIHTARTALQRKKIEGLPHPGGAQPRPRTSTAHQISIFS